MARRPLPATVAMFRVDLGDGGSAVFAQVVLPRFPVTDDGGSPLLALRRAVTDATELYDWWDAARGGSDKPRTVIVEALAADGTPRKRWRFTGARPVALSFTPFDGGSRDLLMETIELAFERLEMD